MRQHINSWTYRLGISLLILAILAAAIPPRPASALGNRYYVRINGGSDANSGLSWNQAFKNLQKALSVAGTGDTIWVAKGVYYPDEGGSYAAGDRSASFYMLDGRKVYGGFSGVESSLEQRNIAANPTVLSGDVNNDDVNAEGNFIAEIWSDIVGDNAYHVVYASGTIRPVILDGFIITAGKADGVSNNERFGGGVLSHGDSIFGNLVFSGNLAYLGGGMMFYNNPSLSNITFEHNLAVESGGGLYNAGDGSLTDGIFNGNYSYGTGGGMTNSGSQSDSIDPLLTRVVFSNNQATRGGGLYTTHGSPQLTNVTFDSNHALQDGGGMLHTNQGAASLTSVEFRLNTAAVGAGLYVSGTNPGLHTVTFRGNQAVDFGGGIYNSGASPALFAVTFITNTAGVGGGMYNMGGSSPFLDVVTFTKNEAGTGGGMYNENGSAPVLKLVDFVQNHATSNTGGGGGMYNAASSPSLSKINFSGNSAQNAGGGIYNYNGSSPTLTNVTFAGNFASNGGGMRNHFNNNQPQLTNVTFSGNEAQFGAGMSNDSSAPELYSVTFSGNYANQGGGMNNYQSSPQLWNVTFYGNIAEAAGQGGGMYNSSSSLPYLRNVILAGSTNGDCVNGPGGNVAGMYSLIQDTGAWACGANPNVSTFLTGQNPLLGPLTNNGGFTLTHAPLNGSPAIDAVTDDFCSPANDQRGFTRWIDGDNNGSSICDIGAVELGKQVFLPLALR